MCILIRIDKLKYATLLINQVDSTNSQDTHYSTIAWLWVFR